MTCTSDHSTHCAASGVSRLSSVGGVTGVCAQGIYMYAPCTHVNNIHVGRCFSHYFDYLYLIVGWRDTYGHSQKRTEQRDFLPTPEIQTHPLMYKCHTCLSSFVQLQLPHLKNNEKYLECA